MTLLLRMAMVTMRNTVATPTPGSVFKRALCRLNGGHYRVLHTTRHHMALKCVACGHSTPGWDVRPPGR